MSTRIILAPLMWAACFSYIIALATVLLIMAIYLPLEYVLHYVKGTLETSTCRRIITAVEKGIQQ